MTYRLKLYLFQSNHEGQEAADEQADADGRSLIGTPETIIALAELLTVGNGWRIFRRVFGIEKMVEGAGNLLIALGEAEHAGNEQSGTRDSAERLPGAVLQWEPVHRGRDPDPGRPGLPVCRRLRWSIRLESATYPIRSASGRWRRLPWSRPQILLRGSLFLVYREDDPAS